LLLLQKYGKRERVLFIGTQFSILYTSVHPPAGYTEDHYHHHGCCYKSNAIVQISARNQKVMVPQGRRCRVWGLGFSARHKYRSLELVV
jgi:hypothetical protein